MTKKDKTKEQKALSKAQAIFAQTVKNQHREPSAANAANKAKARYQLELNHAAEGASRGNKQSKKELKQLKTRKGPGYKTGGKVTRKTTKKKK